MPVVTMKASGKTIEVAEGTVLLQAIFDAGEMIENTCFNKPELEGKPDCGACHVFVVEGRKSLSKIQRAENEKLDTIVGVGSGSRLACQAKIGTENVTVELLTV